MNVMICFYDPYSGHVLGWGGACGAGGGYMYEGSVGNMAVTRKRPIARELTFVILFLI